jgi:hypothetical protein
VARHLALPSTHGASRELLLEFQSLDNIMHLESCHAEPFSNLD